MQCPPAIVGILTEILTVGLLRIRAHAWNGNADRCAIEADHLHNVPSLLANFKPELLDYYWRIERSTFIQQNSRDEVTGFEPAWSALAAHVGANQDEVLLTPVGGK
jgi:hypothetical protein